MALSSDRLNMIGIILFFVSIVRPGFRGSFFVIIALIDGTETAIFSRLQSLS
jgi:hypothetical protein